MNTSEIAEGINLIEAGLSRFRSGPLDYHLKCLFKARELLLTRFAPFKVGDRVTLVRDLNISRDSGWYFCRHFLVPGEPATVESSECDSDGKLRFYVKFDNESWINGEGEKVLVSDKHLYCLFENDLRLL